MFGYVNFGLVWFDKVEIVITTSKSTHWTGGQFLKEWLSEERKMNLEKTFFGKYTFDSVVKIFFFEFKLENSAIIM